MGNKADPPASWVGHTWSGGMKTPNRRIECEVDFKGHPTVGEYANAFRVLPDVATDDDFFLDFLIYSEDEKKAFLVSRVRVRKDFLPAIQVRLGEALQEIGPNLQVVLPVDLWSDPNKGGGEPN